MMEKLQEQQTRMKSLQVISADLSALSHEKYHQVDIKEKDEGTEQLREDLVSIGQMVELFLTKEKVSLGIPWHTHARPC